MSEPAPKEQHIGHNDRGDSEPLVITRTIGSIFDLDLISGVGYWKPIYDSGIIAPPNTDKKFLTEATESLNNQVADYLSQERFQPKALLRRVDPMYGQLSMVIPKFPLKVNIAINRGKLKWYQKFLQQVLKTFSIVSQKIRRNNSKQK